MEIIEERLRSFLAEIVAGPIGNRAQSFRQFKACGSLEFFGVRDPITSQRWVVDMDNAQCTGSFPEVA